MQEIAARCGCHQRCACSASLQAQAAERAALRCKGEVNSACSSFHKAAATHVAQWSTVQQFSGTTSQKTPLFTVPNEWRIVRSCQKANQLGGNFVVSVMNADGSPMDFAVVNTQGNDGATTYEHQGGGQVYLDIATYSEQWTVEVQVQQ